MINPRDPAVLRHDLIEKVRGVLGAKIVTYMLRRDATAALREDAGGIQLLDDLARLRLIEQVLARLDSDSEASAWFLGLNPRLGEVSPARLLHENDAADVSGALLDAAQAYAR